MPFKVYPPSLPLWRDEGLAPEWSPGSRADSGHPELGAGRSLAERRICVMLGDLQADRRALLRVADVGSNAERFRSALRSTGVTLGRLHHLTPRLQFGDHTRASAAFATGQACQHRLQDCNCSGLLESDVLVFQHSLYYFEPPAILNLLTGGRLALASLHHIWGGAGRLVDGQLVYAVGPDGLAHCQARGNTQHYAHATNEWLRAGSYTDGTRTLHWERVYSVFGTHVYAFWAADGASPAASSDDIWDSRYLGPAPDALIRQMNSTVAGFKQTKAIGPDQSDDSDRYLVQVKGITMAYGSARITTEGMGIVVMPSDLIGRLAAKAANSTRDAVVEASLFALARTWLTDGHYPAPLIPRLCVLAVAAALSHGLEEEVARRAVFNKRFGGLLALSEKVKKGEPIRNESWWQRWLTPTGWGRGFGWCVDQHRREDADQIRLASTMPPRPLSPARSLPAPSDSDSDLGSRSSGDIDPSFLIEDYMSVGSFMDTPAARVAPSAPGETRARILPSPLGAWGETRSGTPNSDFAGDSSSGEESLPLPARVPTLPTEREFLDYESGQYVLQVGRGGWPQYVSNPKRVFEEYSPTHQRLRAAMGDRIAEVELAYNPPVPLPWYGPPPDSPTSTVPPPPETLGPSLDSSVTSEAAPSRPAFGWCVPDAPRPPASYASFAEMYDRQTSPVVDEPLAHPPDATLPPVAQPKLDPVPSMKEGAKLGPTSLEGVRPPTAGLKLFLINLGSEPSCVPTGEEDFTRAAAVRLLRATPEPTEEAWPRVEAMVFGGASVLSRFVVPLFGDTGRQRTAWIQRFPAGMQRRYRDAILTLRDTPLTARDTTASALMKVEKTASLGSTGGVWANGRLITAYSDRRQVVTGPTHKFMANEWRRKFGPKDQNPAVWVNGAAWTAEAFGAWFDAAVSSFGDEVCFAHGDQEKFEAHRTLPALEVFLKLNYRANRGSNFRLAMEGTRTLKATGFRHAQRFSVPAVLGSGVTETSIDSAFRNACGLVTTFGEPRWGELVFAFNGDDYLIISRRQRLPDPGVFAQRMLSLGFECSYAITPFRHEVEFCQMLPYPTADGTVWGPKIGRVLSRLPWCTTASRDDPRGVAIGMWRSVAHIPFLREYVQRVLFLCRGTKVRPVDYAHRAVAAREHEADASTWAFIAERYALHPADLIAFSGLICGCELKTSRSWLPLERLVGIDA